MTLTLGAVSACGSGSGSGPAAKGPITVGLFFPVTGKVATFGLRFLHGSETAIADINSHGGVLGRQLSEVDGDSGGDAVDAVPALRALLIHSPNFVVGPTSLEFSALQPIVDASKIPDLLVLPSSQYDTNADRLVWRIQVPDTTEGTAMALYAKQIGATKCVLMFENTESSQTYVKPITNAFTKAGGTIVANIQLVAHQTSYRSEIITAFANSPQCIFSQVDSQTAGTLFANLRQLGHLNIPFIGTDQFNDPVMAKAIGVADDSKWVTSIAGSSPQGASWQYFTQQYALKNGSDPPTTSAAENYDAVVIAALAMTLAGTSDSSVWNAKIKDVSNPPGTACYTYASCVALIKQGQKINYEGASGPMDFNQYNSVSNGFAIIKFGSDGSTLQTVATITAAQVSAGS
jgi:ABC-type branched-subunit amino acid transport system substrate-binding protein